MPMAGAPRTTMSRIASATLSALASSSQRVSRGNRRWSSKARRSPYQRIAGLSSLAVMGSSLCKKLSVVGHVQWRFVVMPTNPVKCGEYFRASYQSTLQAVLAGKGAAGNADQDGQDALSGQHQHDHASGDKNDGKGIAQEPDCPRKRTALHLRPVRRGKVVIGNAHHQPGDGDHGQYRHQHSRGSQPGQRRCEELVGCLQKLHEGAQWFTAADGMSAIWLSLVSSQRNDFSSILPRTSGFSIWSMRTMK